MDSTNGPRGRAGVRPGTVNDVRELIRMHQGCSQLSITRRYLSPLPVLSTRLAARLLCPPDGFSLVSERNGALVAITSVAPYADTDSWGAGHRTDGPAVRRADIGQLVTDSLQRQGIGTALLLAAAREADRRGFEELAMTIQPDNPAVLPLVHATGLRARVGTRDGLTQVAIALGTRAGTWRELAQPGTRLALAWGEC